MLNWSVTDLAAAARMSSSTIKRVEATTPQPVSDAAFAAVRTALEAEGVLFLDNDGQGAGVRFAVRDQGLRP